MIEDLGGCFHHFSHLLACLQGDGEEIFFIRLRKYYQITEEILSNNRGNMIKLFTKYFEIIEDLGGCFHHFYCLFACPQGDGKEI